MKSTARIAVCAVVTLALTSVGSAAQANHRHHHRVAHDGNTRVLRALGHLDRQIARATNDRRLSVLTDTDRAALETNAAADLSAVEAVATQYSVNPTHHPLRDAKRALRAYRAARYVVATNILRHSERTAARILGLQALVVPGSEDEANLAAASALLAGVTAGEFSATTDHATLHAARLAVAHARALVGQVQDALDAVATEAGPEESGV